MVLEPAAAPRIDIGKFPHFSGSPYLATRLASAVYHIRLLPAEWSRDAQWDFALRQAGVNGLAVCLVRDAERGEYFDPDTGRTLIAGIPRAGILRQYVYRMLKRSTEERREQWDDFLAQNAIPRALDNLVEGLDEKDKDYTLRTLEAVGVLGKGRTDGDGGGSKQFAFQVNIVSPKGQQTTLVEGRIVGQPREPEEQNDRDEIGESGRPDLGRAANRQLREGDRAAAPGAPGADPSADS